jgi:GNAT superfamily N-acetyltransferase
MNSRFSIIDYSNQYRSAIRKILEPIGWAEQYISAAEQNADIFSHNPDVYGVYIALHGDAAIGFIYVQFHVWNRLAQIQGLAVEPNYQRQGIASALVDRAEVFARDKKFLMLKGDNFMKLLVINFPMPCHITMKRISTE